MNCVPRGNPRKSGGTSCRGPCVPAPTTERKTHLPLATSQCGDMSAWPQVHPGRKVLERPNFWHKEVPGKYNRLEDRTYG